MRLEGRVAVVTGAAAGIGRTTVELFAAEGAAIVAIDRDEAGVADLVAELRAAGRDAEAIVLDLADREAVVRAGEELAGRRPVIDVLVHNAGHVDFVPLAQYDDAHWDAMVDVNVRSTMQLTHALLPALRRSTAAAIVANTSVDGILGYPGVPVYSAAKAALIGLVRSTAYELGGDGIRVNCVAPGGIDTSMTRQARFSKRVVEEVARLTPLRRRGTPEEVARAILFLASDDASFVTGEVLVVDGGRTVVTPGALGPA